MLAKFLEFTQDLACDAELVGGTFECRRRAAECEALADSGVDEAAAAQFRAMAKHWTRVADSYGFNVHLERFLQDTYKRGWPFQSRICRSRRTTTTIRRLNQQKGPAIGPRGLLFACSGSTNLPRRFGSRPADHYLNRLERLRL